MRTAPSRGGRSDNPPACRLLGASRSQRDVDAAAGGHGILVHALLWAPRVDVQVSDADSEAVDEMREHVCRALNALTFQPYLYRTARTLVLRGCSPDELDHALCIACDVLLRGASSRLLRISVMAVVSGLTQAVTESEDEHDGGARGQKRRVELLTAHGALEAAAKV